jgi:hypothetical protein
MNGMLSAHIAGRDACYLERVEQRLSYYAGSAQQLEALEARICELVATLADLAAQYNALRRLGAIGRAVMSEVADYHETGYRAERDADGDSVLVEEETCHIPIRDILDERFAYVRALYNQSLLTF